MERTAERNIPDVVVARVSAVRSHAASATQPSATTSAARSCTWVFMGLRCVSRSKENEWSLRSIVAARPPRDRRRSSRRVVHHGLWRCRMSPTAESDSARPRNGMRRQSVGCPLSMLAQWDLSHPHTDSQ